LSHFFQMPIIDIDFRRQQKKKKKMPRSQRAIADGASDASAPRMMKRYGAMLFLPRRAILRATIRHAQAKTPKKAALMPPRRADMLYLLLRARGVRQHARVRLRRYAAAAFAEVVVRCRLRQRDTRRAAVVCLRDVVAFMLTVFT
jgi:predicted acylesterase/phospholipase RssA